MGIAKRTGWVLVGLIIGALATSSLGAVKEQAQAPSRLTVSTAAVTTVGVAAFVKDTKSAGCWIVFSKDSGVSVATAPVQACQ
jgi:hypothetical protein